MVGQKYKLNSNI